MNEMIEYNMSDDLQKDLYGIIENAQQTAIVSVNSVLVIRNWLIGMRISREKMSGTRYERLLQFSDTTARAWYEKEAIEQSCVDCGKWRKNIK